MYDYSTLHQIIELQYKRKTGSGYDDDTILSQSLQLGQGYITPSNYLQNINNILVKPEKIPETNPVYLH